MKYIPKNAGVARGFNFTWITECKEECFLFDSTNTGSFLPCSFLVICRNHTSAAWPTYAISISQTLILRAGVSGYRSPITILRKKRFSRWGPKWRSEYCSVKLCNRSSWGSSLYMHVCLISKLVNICHHFLWLWNRMYFVSLNTLKMFLFWRQVWIQEPNCELKTSR